MEKKRVVITGLGVVSSLGHDPDLYYRNLLDGNSGVTKISSFDVEEYPTQIAGEIKDFNPEGYLDKKQARRTDRCIAYGIVAGKKALEDGKVDLEKVEKSRCGIILGSGMGGMQEYANGVQALLEQGYKKISPFFVPFIITNMPGGMLAMHLGFMGPNYSISTACATSTNTIIAAAQHIQRGEADLMITGGTEAPISPIGLTGFIACKALSRRNEEPERASRPWDKGRDGFVMGEGAAALVLESLESAKARGAKIYAEYKGGGLSCDAHHYTEPRPDGKGIALCIERALQDGGVDPHHIHYVNCHATSTLAGDMVELQALKLALPHPCEVVVNSTKSMIGHCLGAAGALEAVATIKALERQQVHPTINLEDPEPDIQFQAPTKALSLQIQNAISTSFGFGGHNASVVFGKYEE